jgi:DNA repair protein RadC
MEAWMNTDHDAQRSLRYWNLLKLLAGKDSFQKKDIYNEAEGERPGFIGRLVGELERDGYLKRDGLRSRASYKWTEKRKEFNASFWIDQHLFTASVKRSPPAERPRERLLRMGAGQLKTSELLSILIRSGQKGESAMQAGERIAALYGSDLHRLSLLARGELKLISKSVGETAYCQIMAALELGKRISAQEKAPVVKPYKIKNPSDALAYCRKEFGRLAREAVREEFHVVLLDQAHQVMRSVQITVGIADKSLVHPREVFKPAIQESASALILVHNHPSGDPKPSREDLNITREMKSAAAVLGLRILDHIILGKESCLSMMEEKLF